MTFLYFGYGSNILSARLKARCPSAKFLCRASAPNHAIMFSKPSTDTSGKATLSNAPETQIPGVVFEIPTSESGKLDAAEGEGYERRSCFTVIREDSGQEEQVIAYIARKTNAALKPFDWYLALVIAGALERGLGKEHVEMLRQISHEVDLDKTRKSRLYALEALTAHGHTDYFDLLT